MIDLTKPMDQSIEFYQACRDYNGTFVDIFLTENPHILIRNLKYGKRLYQLFPELEQMDFIYQDKKKNSLLFDHSVKVLEYTCDQTIYMWARVAAFMHDYGKLFTFWDMFKNHDAVGLVKTEKFLRKYMAGEALEYFGETSIEAVLQILKYHPKVSQYQRTPNWTDETINQFVNDTYRHTEEIIMVAKADKMASHNFPEYLKPYDEFWDRCKAMSKNIDPKYF